MSSCEDCNQSEEHLPNCVYVRVESLEQKLRVAAEENLRLRIDASKGLYTPTKEAEYERMKAQLRVAREALKYVLKDYYDGSSDSSVGHVLVKVQEALDQTK